MLVISSSFCRYKLNRILVVYAPVDHSSPLAINWTGSSILWHVLADFIGKFERLEEDWARVAQKLGIAEKLPHRRANPRARHYTEYYNPRTREVIANKFKVDIERFGYEFEG